MCDLQGPTRAGFIAGLAACASAVALPQIALATPSPGSDPYTVRVLWIHNAITGQTLEAPFTIDGHNVYLPGYYDLCRLMRDTHVPMREGAVQINIRTIEALYETQQILFASGVHQPIVIHSGYRTPGTNEEVGGAPHSYHLQAKAVDFSVPTVTLETVWNICNSRNITGGLGYYPGSHLHIDCGPRRYWTGNG